MSSPKKIKNPRVIKNNERARKYRRLNRRTE